MAVVIRLSRRGSKHQPRYRVVVADQRRSVTGKYLEVLGYYHPHEEKKVSLDLTKVRDWVKKGARPTERVNYVLKLAEKTK